MSSVVSLGSPQTLLSTKFLEMRYIYNIFSAKLFKDTCLVFLGQGVTITSPNATAFRLDSWVKAPYSFSASFSIADCASASRTLAPVVTYCPRHSGIIQ